MFDEAGKLVVDFDARHSIDCYVVSDMADDLNTDTACVERSHAVFSDVHQHEHANDAILRIGLCDAFYGIDSSSIVLLGEPVLLYGDQRIWNTH